MKEHLPPAGESREPTQQELQLILKLLEEDFTGRDELLKQTENLKVRSIDGDDFSILLVPELVSKAFVYDRVPVEASYFDTPEDKARNMQTRVLLHVVDGLLAELEFYKDDSTSITRRPNLEELDITSLPIHG